jgi:hypothetical protein
MRLPPEKTISTMDVVLPPDVFPPLDLGTSSQRKRLFYCAQPQRRRRTRIFVVSWLSVRVSRSLTYFAGRCERLRSAAKVRSGMCICFFESRYSFQLLRDIVRIAKRDALPPKTQRIIAPARSVQRPTLGQPPPVMHDAHLLLHRRSQPTGNV